MIAVLSVLLVLLAGGCAEEGTVRADLPNRSGKSSVSDRDLEQMQNSLSAGQREEGNVPAPSAGDADDESKIQRRVLEHKEEFAQCARKESLRDGERKAPAGRVVLAFTVNAKGDLLRAGVEESDLSLELKSCLIEALWKIPFPRPRGGREVDLRLPMNFTP